MTIRELIVRVLHHVHSIVLFFLVGYHTTTTPSSTSSSASSTNAGGSRVKNDYDNGSGRGNGGNDSNLGHHQQQQSSSWSSLVKCESPHGLRGNNKINFKNKIVIFVFCSDPYSTFTSQSFFPHNAHRFGGGATGKYIFFLLISNV